MFGLNNLFWYYKESVRKHVEFNKDPIRKTEAEEYFGTYVLINCCK